MHEPVLEIFVLITYLIKVKPSKKKRVKNKEKNNALFMFSSVMIELVN